MIFSALTLTSTLKVGARFTPGLGDIFPHTVALLAANVVHEATTGSCPFFHLPAGATWRNINLFVTAVFRVNQFQ